MSQLGGQQDFKLGNAFHKKHSETAIREAKAGVCNPVYEELIRGMIKDHKDDP